MKEKKLLLGKGSMHYKVFGDGNERKNSIVILHGWGGKSDSRVQVGEGLEQLGYHVIIPDLPGFGKTKLTQSMTLDDYAVLIENFIKQGDIVGKEEIILWGHSNGGAISIKLANRKKIKISTLILNNSAGIRNNPKRSLKRKILNNFSKILKTSLSFFPKIKGSKNIGKLKNIFYRLIGSHDYIDVQKDPKLRQTYLNMIASDLTKDIKNIEQNTLLIWGEKDTYTPMSDGLFMRKNIKKSKLIVLENQKHGIHLHDPQKLIQAFIHNI